MDAADGIRKLKQEALEPKVRKTYFIPKVSKKRAAKIEADKETLKLDEELRKQVWLASAHVCQNCGIHLGNNYKKWNFHHLLEKIPYPQFRHSPENIMLVCLECHSKAHHSNPDLIPEKIKARTLEAEKILLHEIKE